MKESRHYIIFTLDNHLFALYHSTVREITRAVEIRPLPGAPEIIMGVIIVRGQFIPVVNIRKRLGLPPKEVDIRDHLIIGRTATRPVALLVDDVQDVVEIDDRRVAKQKDILPGIGHVDGAINLEDNIVLVHDLEKFLSIEEENVLDQAMANAKDERKETLAPPR